jgi:hypothetical protein
MNPDPYLMAAGPALLAACKNFVRKVESGQAPSVVSYHEMKAAIALAEPRDRQTITRDDVGSLDESLEPK